MIKISRSLLWGVAAAVMLYVSGVFSAGGNTMAPKEAQNLLEQGKIYLVDVREADELAESGTAKGALWLPLSKQEGATPEMTEFLSKVSPSGNKDKDLVFFCRSGRRSGIAAERFKGMGFKTANMGGFSGWVDAGLPTVPKP